MNIAVCGRNLDDIYPLVESFGVNLTTESPELVISYGGDGALLGAERDYPGIPKCPIRDSRSYPKCDDHSEEKILHALFAGELEETLLTKLTGADSKGRSSTGLNDIVVNRLIISSAVRYRLWLNDKLYAQQIVGDGLVAATPFGSTGYYRSITHSFFHSGVGLAFNNSTEPINHLVLDEDVDVHIEILRGPAAMVADNEPDEKRIEKGDFVHISKADEKARIIGLSTFRCPNCYWLRHHRLFGENCF
ncbi:MAG: hypothetical protein ACOCZS_01020 [Verrucomicrobiota bacterium]